MVRHEKTSLSNYTDKDLPASSCQRLARLVSQRRMAEALCLLWRNDLDVLLSISI